jgi:hypothetical protein
MFEKNSPAVDWLQADLERPENAWLIPYFKRSVIIMNRYLVWRHCVALALLIPTVLGGVLMYVGIRKLTRQAVSGRIDSFERSGLVLLVNS